MNKSGLAASILVLGFAVTAGTVGVHAQQATTTPNAKVQPVTPTPPPATTTAKSTAKTEVKKKATASPCQGLDEKVCGAKATECSWVAATKRKDGKDVKAYCRKKSGTSAKATTTTKTAPAAPTVPSAAPSTTPPAKK